MSIRAVCFDLGGVVARISYHWSELLHRSGFRVPDHIQPGHELTSIPVFETFQSGLIGTAEYYRELGSALELTSSQAEVIHRNILIEPFPGVLEIVQELTSRGIVTGCLSNTNAPHWEQLLTAYPAISAMDHKLASHEIDASKPDSAAYRAFERATGCSGPEILLFDDSQANCDAAIWLGWQAVRIDPSGDPAAQMRGALRL